MRTVTIERKRGFYGRFRALRLFIDDDYVGEIRCGERMRIQIPDGARKLYGKMDWGRTRPFNLDYVEDGARLVITSAFSLNRLELLGILFIPLRIGLASDN